MKKTIFVSAVLFAALVIAGCTEDKSSDTQTVSGDAASKAAAAAQSSGGTPANDKIPPGVKDKIPNVALGMNTGK